MATLHHDLNIKDIHNIPIILKMNTMIRKFLLLFILCNLAYSAMHELYAQAPNKMQYQAVVRNASGEAFSYYIVRVRTSILQGTSSGPSSYTETQLLNTDANGLVKVEIGAGMLVSGDFATINWANGPYFIKQ